MGAISAVAWLIEQARGPERPWQAAAVKAGTALLR
jgi:hypothetical protein